MFLIDHLPNQQPGEKIIRIIRRDLFILLKKIIMFLGLFLLPLILLFVIISAEPQFLIGEISLPLLVLGTSAYYLFIWAFFFFSFIDYYLDVWFITDERIIDIQQQGFFSRVISEQKLFRIQDVTSEVKGIWPTVFAFGDVYVQTAGTKTRFHFDDVPKPDEVRDLIIKLAEKRRHEVQTEEDRDS